MKTRNVTLRMETYERLDKYLLELIQKKGEPKVSRNDAIEALLDYYYSKK